MFGSRKSKAVAVAKEILSCAHRQGLELTPMQLLKLVYIAQGWMLAKYGRTLFDEQVQAWQYGPVVPSVYQAIKQFGSSPVASVDAPDVEFNEDERKVMDFVTRTYGKATGIALSTATHQPGTPWSQTWAVAAKSTPISNDLIRSFYESIVGAPTHSAL